MKINYLNREMSFLGQVGERIPHPHREVWVYSLTIEEPFINRKITSNGMYVISRNKMEILFGTQIEFNGTPIYTTGDWVIVTGNLSLPLSLENSRYLLSISLTSHQLLKVEEVVKLKMKRLKMVKIINMIDYFFLGIFRFKI